MEDNMQTDRACTDTLTDGNNVFGIPTERGNIVTNPYIFSACQH